MTTQQWAKIRAGLDVAAAVAMFAAAVSIVWVVFGPARPRTDGSGTRAKAGPPIPATPIHLAGASVLGDHGAPVGVVIFSDFQCPFCGRFAQETLPAVRAAYVQTGKILLAFKHLPLETIHSKARDAAELAVCADRQGRFWAVHDFFFANSKILKEDGLLSLPSRLGVNEAQLRGCLDSKAADELIDKDVAEARQLGIRSTPSFVIGTLRGGDALTALRMESGAVPVKAFSAMLDEALKATAVPGR